MTRELLGFYIELTYPNGFQENYTHLFKNCESVMVAMDRYVAAITYLETQGSVVTRQIWSN